MYCKNCGNEIKENEKFCTKCGTKISNDIEHINNLIQDKSESGHFSKKKNIIIISIIIIFIIILGIIMSMIFNNKNIENSTEYIADKIKKEDFRLDNTAETGITYNFNLNEIQQALDKACDENKIKRFTKFEYITSNDYNMVYDSYADETSTADFTIIIQIHNNYIASIAYQYTNENLEFAESTGKKIFYDTLKELFNKEYINPIIEILEELPNNKSKYDNYTLCMKVKDEQQGINQYDLSASSQEYAEKLKSAYPNMFNIEDSMQESENGEPEFIKQIRNKYPDLPSRGIGICSNEYGEYWLLDKDGKKVYFSSLEGFEEALAICRTSEETSEVPNNMSEAEAKYNQIYEGMSYYQVISILGKPYSSTNNTSIVRTCTWVINNEIIMVQFMNDVVYQVIFNENKNNEKKLDPETTHSISWVVGFPIEDYTNDLDEWGIKYKIVKEENHDYGHNVVTKIEPNNCSIDKDSVITFTVSDNTYTMKVVVDTSYLLELAGIPWNNYNEQYDYEQGKYVGTELKLLLKINGKTVFEGNTEYHDIIHAKILGEITGKTTDTYSVEATIEGVKIEKEIEYYFKSYGFEERTFEITDTPDYGMG